MIRSHVVLPCAAALALGACSAASAPQAAPAPALPPIERAAATITPEDMHARIAFLAADEMRGRDTPSPELEIVANYLVNQHRLFGLEPAGENGTYVQRYPFPLRRMDPARTSLRVSGPAGTRTLEYGRDFFTRGGTTADLTAPLVFAGQAEGLGEGTMRRRIPVVALPGTYTRDWRLARDRMANAAKEAGAEAIVYVLDPAWSADSVAHYMEMYGRPSRTLGAEVAFPQFFVRYDAAEEIFRAGELALDDRWRATFAADGAVTPVPLTGLTATGGIPLEMLDDATAPNVVAVLPGSDSVLRDEYVVVSAHMDHVGVGRPVDGDSIYNGADDDASGTSALLEVAQALASLPTPPKRSVVFLHVSGEEKGLLGSEWYSDHPTLPLERIVANINVDMIARNSPDSVVVIGKDYSTLGETTNRLNAAHPELNLVTADDIWPEERFFFRSDHYNFARKEVPSIFFFSGVHEDYHRPSDEVERIDADKAARIARMVLYLAHEVADTTERPQWDPEGLEEVRSLTR